MASGITVKVRNPAGDNFDVSLPSLDSTFSELTDIIIKTHFPGQEKKITYVVSGRVVDMGSTMREHGVPEKIIYAVIRGVQPEKASAPTRSSTSATENSYTAQQIRIAIKKEPCLYLHLLHLLARTNPYILSYIGLSPALAQEEIDRILDNETFLLKVALSDDPFSRAIHSNPYLVDKDNVEYIMLTAHIEITEESFSRVKDLYLYLDRNINMTLQYLNG
jgi:hypothetical protein